MREMKDCHASWAGQIPSEWNTIGFNKAIQRMATGLNPRDNFQLSKEEEFFYVTIRNFKNGALFLDDNCDRISPQAWEIIQERSQLKKGDILFASISKEGQVYLLKDDPANWNINESVFCIRVNEECFDASFFCYHLINPAYYSDLLMDATGSTFLSIKQNKLKSSVLVMPPIGEQKKIARELDVLCSQIDSLVANEQLQIEKLKAYKQSLISKVVTKGLNPSVLMKDSGVEWLGTIPEHWKVLQIARAFKERNEPGSDELPILTVSINTGISSEQLDESEIGKAVIRIEDKSKYKRVYVGDIAYNTMRAWQGAIGSARVDGVVSPAYVVAKPLLDLDTRYMEYLLRSSSAIEEIRKYSYGIMDFRLRCYWQYFRRIFICIPPKDEQERMADYLDKILAETDQLIELKQSKIEKLDDYKKSLIYEYVTGKKEVV